MCVSCVTLSPNQPCPDPGSVDAVSEGKPIKSQFVANRVKPEPVSDSSSSGSDFRLSQVVLP